MKSKLAKRQHIWVAVVESDPLRVAGFKAVLDEETDLQLTALSSTEIAISAGIDVVLVAGQNGTNALRNFKMLREVRADLRVLMTGSGINDSLIFNALAAGAKGYVDEGAPVKVLVKAIRTVAEGLIWAPRRVVANFIERSNELNRPANGRAFTSREKEVLGLLIEGRPNKEIGLSLGIEERTVKAHVAKLMRKTGVQNRIMLSVHALRHGFVAAG
jgi:DNA-binding NarL/FixJ family response regulator